MRTTERSNVWAPASYVQEGAAGRLKGDRHIRMTKYTPLSNLMITLLDKAGVPTDHFGESSGRIEL